MNVQSIALSHLSCNDVWNEVKKPFEVGAHLFVKASDSDLNLMDRVTYYFQAMLLWTPIVNYVALKVLGMSILNAPVRYASVSLPASIPQRYDFRDKVDMANDQVEDYFNLLLKNYPGREIYLHPYEMIDVHNIAARVPATFSTDHKELCYLVRMTSLTPGRNHWGLIFIDRALRTVEFYNSKHPYNEEPQIEAHLRRITQQLTAADPGTPYVFQSKLEKRLQPDTYQCGPWVCYFLENRLANPTVDFNLMDADAAQPMIADFRNRVLRKLVDAHAQGII